MDVRTANLSVIRAITGSWDVAAAYLGMSRNSLHNRVYEVKGQRLSVDDSLALQSLSKTTYFAEAVAIASGGGFFQLPDVGGIESDSIQTKFNEIYADVGELFNEYRADIGNDGVIDDEEMERLDKIAADLHKKAEELMALMAAMRQPRNRVFRRDDCKAA